MKSLLGIVVCAAALTAADTAAENARTWFSGDTRIRVVHASPDAPAVDVYLDGKKVLANLPFGQYSAYLPVINGNREIRVNVAGTGTTVLQRAPLLNAGSDYTILAVGRVNGHNQPLDIQILTDDNRKPRARSARVRVFHGAPGAPAVDLYLTTPFEALDDMSPAAVNVPYRGVSPYYSVPQGQYQLRVAVTGTKTVAIDSGRLSLPDRGIFTVIAVDQQGGGSPFGAIVLDDNQ